MRPFFFMALPIESCEGHSKIRTSFAATRKGLPKRAMSKHNAHAVILAGGSGSRLWPVSRQHLPKQFLMLKGDETLLQASINWLAPVIAAQDVLIVTQEAYAKGEAYHALRPYQLLHEPHGLPATGRICWPLFARHMRKAKRSLRWEHPPKAMCCCSIAA
jgi:hypothetical protein